jgi:molybdopterin biosynthesis enzyme
VKLRVIRIGSSGPASKLEVVRRVELGPEPQVVRLESGEQYVIHVRATLPEGEAAFFFLTSVP